METDFSDEPGWFCDGGPHRAVQNQGSYCTGRPRRTVRYRKRRCGVRSPHYGAGNLPRPYHRKERPFWKSASANRPGPGFRTAKSESDSRRGRTSGAAERQRVCEANEQRRRPAKACRAGLPLKGAVCGSRLGLKWRACAASAGAREYAPHKDTAEWLD